MDLIRFFLANTQIPRAKFAFYSLLAGVANVLILALLNSSAEHASNSAIELILVAIFSINIVIYVLAQKFVWKNSIQKIEDMVHVIRLRIVRKIAGSSLENLERTGKTDLYAAINQHTFAITASAMPIIISLQSVVLVFFTLLYIAYLSLIAFCLTLLFLCIAIFFSIRRSRHSKTFLGKAIVSEKNAYQTISDLLEGIKEVKLHRMREEDLVSSAQSLSFQAKGHRVTANQEMAFNFVKTQTSFYMILGVLVFLIPQLGTETYPDIVVKITTAGLFIIGPINSFISILPTFTNAESSLNFIKRVESLLDKEQESDASICAPLEAPKVLSLQNIGYTFTNETGQPTFSIGPISLDIHANEIVFITGGNGSGKTTLIKVLLGLYPCRMGRIKYNDTDINEHNVFAYRNCFSAILSDYHLFGRFYGLGDVDETRVEELLEKMQLSKKTALVNGEFDTINLSTGQRKRLALIVAILEDRPIIVLDEWAADQDPTFRKVFYEEILPELKAKGKTIIAITHDEKYFSNGDRHLHMDEGLLEVID